MTKWYWRAVGFADWYFNASRLTVIVGWISIQLFYAINSHYVYSRMWVNEEKVNVIGRLRGIILEKQPPLVLLETNGVGYEVQLPMTCFL